MYYGIRIYGLIIMLYILYSGTLFLSLPIHLGGGYGCLLSIIILFCGPTKIVVHLLIMVIYCGVFM